MHHGQAFGDVVSWQSWQGGGGPRRDVLEHGIGGMASIVEYNQLLLNL
jgi:hypothetical protein